MLLRFAEPPVEIQMQHYAFMVDDELFDTEHGGRGVYFLDPSGHAIEIITRPYL